MMSQEESSTSGVEFVVWLAWWGREFTARFELNINKSLKILNVSFTLLKFYSFDFNIRLINKYINYKFKYNFLKL